MTVHPHANAFDESAADYEAGRPGYPHELLAVLDRGGRLGQGKLVIDLGAGTGKLTRLLTESAARIIAVEPVPAMREEFAQVLPDVEMVDATAEELPFEDQSVDLVTCGQSFKWFATDNALFEIARVLRTKGRIALIFNEYDGNSPIEQKLVEIQAVAAAETVEDKPGSNWKAVALGNPAFQLVDEVALANEHVVDRDGLFGRVRSSSQFARLPAARQGALIDSLDAMVVGETVTLTLRTDVMTLEKTAARS